MHSDLKKFEQVIMALADKDTDLAEIKYRSQEAVGLDFGDRLVIANHIEKLIISTIDSPEEYKEETKMVAYMLTGVYEELHARRYEIIRRYCSSLLNLYPKERRKRVIEKAYETEEIFRGRLDTLSQMVFGEREGLMNREDGKKLKALKAFKRAYNDISPIIAKDLDSDRDINLYKEKEIVKNKKEDDNIGQISLEAFRDI